MTLFGFMGTAQAQEMRQVEHIGGKKTGNATFQQVSPAIYLQTKPI
ncbi:hypothetical protein [Psychrobacter phenylpyruvicus]|nr:hypothetical protein [Psychrobacter phenylpyruvicus]